MKPNIVLVGFNDQMDKDFGKYISDRLDMFFADVEGLVEYNIYSSREALLRCGKEYVDKEERKTVMSVAEFENSVIYLTFDTFIKYSEFFDETCFKILIVSKISEIDSIVINDRIELTKNKFDYILKMEKLDFGECFNKIIEGLKNEY